MKKLRKRSVFGFTLLELMVTVTVIGILAAVAIPMVSRYLKKAKSSEVGLNLRKIYDGEVAYFQIDQANRGGQLISRQFVGLSRTPANPGVNKQRGNFETPGWQQIKFSPDSPVLYGYSVLTSGLGTSAQFTARAEGDLNGDGFYSLYERIGAFDPVLGEVVGGAGLYAIDEIE